MDVIELTKELVAIESETHHSNVAVSDHIESVMRTIGFEIERISYIDTELCDEPTEKVNLVGRLGPDTDGGIGFFGHSDVVPGGQGWTPYEPIVRDGKLYGRGSCDMKGAVASMLVAAGQVGIDQLRYPVFVAVTADEEMGHTGAKYIVENSNLLGAGWPRYAVVGEPTEMIPVYAHKGGVRIDVTAHGRAAHTSTERGISANLLMAPFLAEMAELATLFKTEQRFQNGEFDPPTNGFNMVIDDGGCKLNVTAAKTVCSLGLRAMPDAAVDEATDLIVEAAKRHGFAVAVSGFDPFYISPASDFIQHACRLTGHEHALAVPYGTEAVWYQARAETLVLGPGDIAQAHTMGEWVTTEQLNRAVDLYGRFIREFCY